MVSLRETAGMYAKIGAIEIKFEFNEKKREVMVYYTKPTNIFTLIPEKTIYDRR